MANEQLCRAGRGGDGQVWQRSASNDLKPKAQTSAEPSPVSHADAFLSVYSYFGPFPRFRQPFPVLPRKSAQTVVRSSLSLTGSSRGDNGALERSSASCFKVLASFSVFRTSSDVLLLPLLSGLAFLFLLLLPHKLHRRRKAHRWSHRHSTPQVHPLSISFSPFRPPCPPLVPLPCTLKVVSQRHSNKFASRQQAGASHLPHLPVLPFSH